MGYNKYNNKRTTTVYDVVVFCEETRRKFFHKGLRRWEVEALRFNPHLNVKIVNRAIQDFSGNK
jgi:hypothetical protein